MNKPTLRVSVTYVRGEIDMTTDQFVQDEVSAQLAVNGILPLYWDVPTALRALS